MTTLARESHTPPASETAALTWDDFEKFRALIFRETGIHLKDVKHSMLASRLARRLRALHLDSFTDYYKMLVSGRAAPDELRNMINAVTTNKTSFFREASHFEFLGRWARQQFRERGHLARLRIWSCACSTGQEPYTIAIALRETFADSMPAPDPQILASDIDTAVIETARQAVYPESALQELGGIDPRRYFLRGKGANAGSVKVKPEIQRLVEFRQVNLIADAWPVTGGFDAIFCRNVMIYFDQATKVKLFARLVGQLKPGGHLFLGHAESIQGMTHLALPVHHSVYRVVPQPVLQENCAPVHEPSHG